MSVLLQNIIKTSCYPMFIRVTYQHHEVEHTTELTFHT